SLSFNGLLLSGVDGTLCCQSSLPVFASNAKTCHRFASPPVKKTRSATMIGELFPGMGTGDFQTMFLPEAASQLSGTLLYSEIPDPPEPRKQGQSSAEQTWLARDTAAKTAHRRFRRISDTVRSSRRHRITVRKWPDRR